MEKVQLNSINKKQNGLDQSKNEKSTTPPPAKSHLRITETLKRGVASRD